MNDLPVCTCGHGHWVHDSYGSGPPDATGEPTILLGCSRCACSGMTADTPVNDGVLAAVERDERQLIAARAAFDATDSSAGMEDALAVLLVARDRYLAALLAEREAFTDPAAEPSN